MADDSVIKVENVSKDFILPHEKANSVKSLFTGAAKKSGKRGKETQHALKDISLEIKEGEFFGIVGRNGSGKSTLLKILAGIYQPTSGQVQTKGKLVPFIELGVGFNGELTGRENVYLNGAMLGFSKKEVEAMYQEVVDFAELERFMDQKLKNYSSGMQVRLAFSLAIRAEADILLVDEVLAVGDADFQRKCFRYFKQLKKENTTVIFVTHDMNAVREYCDRGVLIEKSKIVAAGKPEDISKLYEQLLMPHTDDESPENSISKRWGDGTIKIENAEVLKSDAERIILSLNVVAKKNCDDPILGFVLKNGAGVPLVGTNTMLQKQKATPLKAGEKRNVEWSFENVLADGDYTVTFAAQYDSGITTGEWWEDACNIRVVRASHVPYDIDPGIKTIVK